MPWNAPAVFATAVLTGAAARWLVPLATPAAPGAASDFPAAPATAAAARPAPVKASPPLSPAQAELASLLDALWQAQPEDMPGWLTLAQTSHPALRLPVWDRWLELDPVAAWAAVSKPLSRHSEDDRQTRREFFALWCRRDLAAATTCAAAQERSIIRRGEYRSVDVANDALSGILIFLSNTDPGAVSAFLREYPSALASDLTERTFALLARQDVRTALDLASSLSAMAGGLYKNNDMLGPVLAVWSGSDPAAAAAWVNGLYPVALRQEIIVNWKGPPRELLTLVEQMGPQTNFTDPFSNLPEFLQSALATLPAPDAMAWASSHTPATAWLVAMGIRQKSGFAAMLSACRQISEPGLRDSTLAAALSPKDSEEPEFQQLLADTPEGSMRQTMLELQVTHLARTDLAGALRLSGQLMRQAYDREAPVTRFLLDLCNQYEAGFPAALTSLSRADRQKVLIGIQDSAPLALFEAALTTLDPGADRDQWVRTSAANYSNTGKNPQNWNAILTRLPTEADRLPAVAGIVDSLDSKDFLAGSEWIAALPRSPVRDTAAAGLSKKLIDTDPEAAWHWARDIQEPPLRQLRETEAAAAWLKQKPEAARAALERSAP